MVCDLKCTQSTPHNPLRKVAVHSTRTLDSRVRERAVEYDGSFTKTASRHIIRYVAVGVCVGTDTLKHASTDQT